MGEAVSNVLARTTRLREPRSRSCCWCSRQYGAGPRWGAAAPGEWRWSLLLAVAVVAVLAVVWWIAPSTLLGADADA